AEDGIRDFHVTGVQTCALPISPVGPRPSPTTATSSRASRAARLASTWFRRCALPRVSTEERIGRFSPQRERPSQPYSPTALVTRSEERRVGKDWRSLRTVEH